MARENDQIEPIDATFEDVVDKVVGIKNLSQEELDALPFAKWRGKIDLGGNELDCYVLNDETRVPAGLHRAEIP